MLETAHRAAIPTSEVPSGLNRAKLQDVGSLLRMIDTQRATIAGLKGRMAEVRTEVASWRDLHARIWEPFGPDAAPKARRTGIGGPSATAVAPSTGRPSPSDEVDRLANVVREEGDNL